MSIPQAVICAQVNCDPPMWLTPRPDRSGVHDELTRTGMGKRPTTRVSKHPPPKSSVFANADKHENIPIGRGNGVGKLPNSER